MSSCVSTIRNFVPSGQRDQSAAALITFLPERRAPMALRLPPASVWVYAVVRTLLTRLGVECVLAVFCGGQAQLAPSKAKPLTKVSLRRVVIPAKPPVYRLQPQMARDNFLATESTPVTPTLAARSGQVARAMRATCCLDRDRHRASRAIFRDGRLLGRGAFHLVQRFHDEENAERHDQKVDHQGDEVSVIPGDGPGRERLRRGGEGARSVGARFQHHELV